MGHSVLYWGMKVFEVLFFAGLAGCVFVVLISWVSIAKSSFSKDK